MPITTSQNNILQLIVGMFDAAPGAAYLAEFETSLSSHNGDIKLLAADLGTTGTFNQLYPSLLTNNEFAAKFIGNLVGTEVSADGKAWAVNWVEGLLNGGASRTDTMVTAIEALKAVDPTDSVWGNAQKALVNQTSAAEYYSVDLNQSSTDFTALQTAVASTTSDALTIPAAFTVSGGLAKLSAANEKLADFQTVNPSTGTALTTAETAYNTAVGGASDIANDSSGLATAFLADAKTTNATGLATAKTAQTDAQTALDAVTGLSAAVTAQELTGTALKTADNSAAQAVIDLNAAEATYNLNSVDNANAIADTVATTISDSNIDLIVTVDGSLQLNTDTAGDGNTTTTDVVTEAAFPGITALLTALVANNAAIKTAADALTANNEAVALVDRLDVDDQAAVDALKAVGAGMGKVTPVDADLPTQSEVEGEAAALLVGLDSLRTELQAITFTTDEATTEAAHAAITSAGVTAGFLSSADATALNTAFDTAQGANGTTTAASITATVSALGDETTGNDNAASTFSDLVSTYTAAAGSVNPLITALTTANTAVETAETKITDLDSIVVDLGTAQAAVTSETALTDAIAVVVKTFTDESLLAPVSIDGNKVATEADAGDIFIAETTDASISNFGVLGGDKLYIGEGYTLNSGVYNTDGDNAVLEVFAVQNGLNVDITIESEVYSSSTNATETVITLTGTTLAEVTYDGGIFSAV